MRVDLQSTISAVEPPVIALDGEELEGRWLSLIERARFARLMKDVDTDRDEETAVEDMLELVEKILDAMDFPGERLIAVVEFETLMTEVVAPFFEEMSKKDDRMNLKLKATEKRMTSRVQNPLRSAASASSGRSTIDSKA